MEPLLLDFEPGVAKIWIFATTVVKNVGVPSFSKPPEKETQKAQKEPPWDQEPPEVPQERPRAAQSRLPSGLGGQLGPTWRPKAPRRLPGSHFGSPAKRFPTLRGISIVNFALSGKLLQNDACFQADCSVGKPRTNRPTQLETLAAQACVAIVPTQLSD